MKKTILYDNWSPFEPLVQRIAINFSNDIPYIYRTYTPHNKLPKEIIENMVVLERFKAFKTCRFERADLQGLDSEV